MSKKKKILGLMVVLGLVSSSTVMAKPADKQPVSPGSGSVQFYDQPLNENKKAQTFGMMAAAASTSYQWSARFTLSNHFQIPNTISGATWIDYGITTETNTGTNTTYDLKLDYLNNSTGYWYTSQTHSSIPVNGYKWSYFSGLSSSTKYRLHVYGNVKGGVDVYY